MKKTLLIFALSCFLLTACGSQEASIQDQNVDALQTALNNEDYGKAHTLLSESYERGELGPDGIAIFEEIEATYVNNSYRQGMKAFNDKDFTAAVEHLSVVTELSENEEVKETLARAVYLETEQENFNLYLVTFKDMLDESNILLKRYNRLLDEVSTGHVTTNQFISHIRNTIPESSVIISNLDNHIYEVDSDLLTLHKEMIALIHKQHAMFISSLELNSENRQSSLSQLRGEYVAIKQEQTTRIQNMKLFANERGLAMNVDLDETLRDISSDPLPVSEDNDGLQEENTEDVEG